MKLKANIVNVIASEEVIRDRVSQINLVQTIKNRIKCKAILKRVLRAYRVRKAVNEMIRRRKLAKRRILRFFKNWKLKNEATKAAILQPIKNNDSEDIKSKKDFMIGTKERGRDDSVIKVGMHKETNKNHRFSSNTVSKEVHQMFVTICVASREVQHQNTLR